MCLWCQHVYANEKCVVDAIGRPILCQKGPTLLLCTAKETYLLGHVGLLLEDGKLSLHHRVRLGDFRLCLDHICQLRLERLALLCMCMCAFVCAFVQWPSPRCPWACVFTRMNKPRPSVLYVSVCMCVWVWAFIHKSYTR